MIRIPGDTDQISVRTQEIGAGFVQVERTVMILVTEDQECTVRSNGNDSVDYSLGDLPLISTYSGASGYL